MKKKIIGWMGFIDGKPEIQIESGWDKDYKIYEVFLTKKRAKFFYDDIRKVEIREV